MTTVRKKRQRRKKTKRSAIRMMVVAGLSLYFRNQYNKYLLEEARLRRQGYEDMKTSILPQGGAA